MAGEMVIYIPYMEGLFCIFTRHILCVSVSKQIDEEHVVIYRFVQQPEFMPNAMYTVVFNGRGEIFIPALSFVANIVAQNKADYGRTVTFLSYKTPMTLEPEFSNINKSQLITRAEAGGPELRSAVLQISYFERKQNWIIRCLPRSKGNKSDLSYVHLQTDKQFRSLPEVYNFVKHGVLPERRRTKRGDVDNNTTASQARRIRGHKLVNRIPVGYYDHIAGQVVRQEIPPRGGRDENTLVGTGSKRKREDENQAQVLNAAHGIRSPHVYVLYDFEPKM